jgi:16S rRNA (cytosine967-C5)-methyltransferase
MHNGETQPSIDQRNYFQKYLQYAALILSSFEGGEPFHIYLKKYFARNRKHGSKDRKIITALCYNYFRLGVGVIKKDNPAGSLLLAVYLCENAYSALLAFFKPEWSASIEAPLSEKIDTVGGQFDSEHIFHFLDELSEQINIHGLINLF